MPARPATRPGVDRSLGDHEERIRALERAPGGGGGCDEGPWHNVGEDDEPPFEGDWANLGGDRVPTRFRTVCDEVEIEIAATGTSASVIFTLPEGFRPAYTMEGTISDGTPGGVQNITVGTDGTVYAE